MDFNFPCSSQQPSLSVFVQASSTIRRHPSFERIDAGAILPQATRFVWNSIWFSVLPVLPRHPIARLEPNADHIFLGYDD